MPITPTLQVDPQVMTANWTAGLNNPANQAKLIYGYDHPDVPFNQNPTQSQQSWMAGITRAQTANKYATGMQNADLNAASIAMHNTGAAAWSAAGTTKQYKFARKAANLANAINTVKAKVVAMPKGRGQANINRAVAWMQGMAAYYGQI